MVVLWLLAGFILLMKGADIFVAGSSSVAKLLKIPTVIIGLTIVALGTSLPEASVSISASLAGQNAISVSNVVGSNIFNLMCIVGVCALIKNMPVEEAIGKRDIYVNLATTGLLLLFMIGGVVTRIEGIVFLIATVVYILVLIRSVKDSDAEENQAPPLGGLKSGIFIIFGIAAIILGGNLVVDNACIIAEKLGMSQTFIGLTIVAIGTSLPELVTSLVAAKKGENGLALGNVIGSNILNILLILGASGTLSPLVIQSESIIDVVLLLLMTIIMLLFVKSGKEITRKEGAVCIALYILYSAYITLR